MKEKTIDTKIDELAQAVAKGFEETRKDIDTKIDELAQMTAQGFTEMEENRKRDLIQLRGDVDIMLDKHIGVFRKDYDALAVRVKDLELA